MLVILIMSLQQYKLISDKGFESHHILAKDYTSLNTSSSLHAI